ncbi:MAG: hypothetical protein II956_10745 [Bacteroidales bacterium]|nr:hypothetical protein [Bacteroidales bacterium]
MNISLFTQHIKVFVAEVSPDMKEVCDKLCVVLLKAGISVIRDKTLMSEADCSVHILGQVDFYNENSQGYSLDMGVQYREAAKLRNSGLKMFIWNPASRTEDYVNNIRREIIENTVYSTKPSPIVFVEELRGIMSVKTSAKQEVLERDVFFIYNDLDKETASGILNMLQDVQTVIPLGIAMNSDTDYTEYIKNQLQGCKIGVVYFDYAGDWAVSFARQIWKDNGGQSGKTPLFIVGNADHANDEVLRVFDGVIETAIREISIIPLDIKVFFDKHVK